MKAIGTLRTIDNLQLQVATQWKSILQPSRDGKVVAKITKVEVKED